MLALPHLRRWADAAPEFSEHAMRERVGPAAVVRLIAVTATSLITGASSGLGTE